MKFILFLFTLLLSIGSVNASSESTVGKGVSAKAVVRFEVQSDPVMGQVIVDRQNKLTWMYCLVGHEFKDGQCTGVAQNVSYYEAETLANELGWRIPTKNELAMISRNRSGYLDSLFNNAPTNPNIVPLLWTGTGVTNRPNDQWVWHLTNPPIMGGGMIETLDKSQVVNVRLVKDGIPSSKPSATNNNVSNQQLSSAPKPAKKKTAKKPAKKSTKR